MIVTPEGRDEADRYDVVIVRYRDEQGLRQEVQEPPDLPRYVVGANGITHHRTLLRDLSGAQAWMSEEVARRLARTLRATVTPSRVHEGHHAQPVRMV